MKAALNRIAALLGYVPAPAKYAPCVIKMELDFEIDSSPVDAAITKLDRLSDAARRAESAIADVLMAQAGEFIDSLPISDETQALILAELRKQNTLLEVLAKQGDCAAWHKHCAAPHDSATEPATGAAASGLPG
jgi:hypothetical protein